jgi:hypothetical protein
MQLEAGMLSTMGGACGNQIISVIHEEEYEAKLMSIYILHFFGNDVDTFRSSDRSAIYAGEDRMTRVFEELEIAEGIFVQNAIRQRIL